MHPLRFSHSSFVPGSIINQFLFSIMLILILSSCATYKYKKQGFVETENYDVEISFKNDQNFIFIPVVIQGKSYNFLLDTGAELNIIDHTIARELDFKNLKKGMVSSGNTSVSGNQRVEINTIEIGGIEFQNTVGMIWDVSNFSKYIRCERIDGIIGNNLMRKANWQIDYQNQTIRITDNIDNLPLSNNSKKIPMNAGEVGNIYLQLEINQQTMPFTFDTGYNGFAQTGDMSLMRETVFTKVGIKGANFAGSSEGSTHYVKIKDFKINDLTFQSPSHFLIKLNNSSILGNEFFKNYRITIDWDNDNLILDKHDGFEIKEPRVYEVSFFTDFEKGIVTIGSIDAKSILFETIKPKSKVLKINNVDLIELERNGALCSFWSEEWQGIKSSDMLMVTLEEGGLERQIEVKMIKNAW